MPMPSNSSRRKTRLLSALVSYATMLAGLGMMAVGLIFVYLGGENEGSILVVDKLLGSLFVLVGAWALVQAIFKR